MDQIFYFWQKIKGRMVLNGTPESGKNTTEIFWKYFSKIKKNFNLVYHSTFFKQLNLFWSVYLRFWWVISFISQGNGIQKPLNSGVQKIFFFNFLLVKFSIFLKTFVYSLAKFRIYCFLCSIPSILSWKYKKCWF